MQNRQLYCVLSRYEDLIDLRLDTYYLRHLLTFWFVLGGGKFFQHQNRTDRSCDLFRSLLSCPYLRGFGALAVAIAMGPARPGDLLAIRRNNKYQIKRPWRSWRTSALKL